LICADIPLNLVYILEGGKESCNGKYKIHMKRLHVLPIQRNLPSAKTADY
jgi:hypothetical protein